MIMLKWYRYTLYDMTIIFLIIALTSTSSNKFLNLRFPFLMPLHFFPIKNFSKYLTMTYWHFFMLIYFNLFICFYRTCKKRNESRRSNEKVLTLFILCDWLLNCSVCEKWYYSYNYVYWTIVVTSEIKMVFKIWFTSY